MKMTLKFIRFINRTNECFMVRAGIPSDKAIPYRAGFRYDKEKHRVRGKPSDG